MLNTKDQQLTRVGVTANIVLVAAFSLVLVFLIAHRQDFATSSEAAGTTAIAQTVSLQHALGEVKHKGG